MCVEAKFRAFVKDYDAVERHVKAPHVAEIEKRERIISGLSKRQSDLNSQLSDATNKIQKLEQQKEDCEEKVKEKVQEVAELHEDWVEDCEDLHEESQRLQTRVTKEDRNIAELQASYVTLNVQLGEIQRENTVVESELQDERDTLGRVHVDYFNDLQ